MAAYNVLVYSGRRSLPARHLVTAIDTSMASAIADELLTRSRTGVGVEVVRDGERLYSRGVIPARVFGQAIATPDDAVRSGVEAVLPLLQARSGRQVETASRSRANLRT